MDRRCFAQLLLAHVLAFSAVTAASADPVNSKDLPKSSTQPASTSPNIVAAAPNKPFKSKSGYSIQPPTGWLCDISGSTGTDLFAKAPKPANSGFTPNINIIVHAVPPATTIKDIKDSLASDLDSAPTYKLVVSDVATVADENALHVLLNFDQGTPVQHLRSEEYLVLHGSDLYEITYTAPRSEREMYANQFSAMLHSLKWIPITLPPAAETQSTPTAK